MIMIFYIASNLKTSVATDSSTDMSISIIFKWIQLWTCKFVIILLSRLLSMTVYAFMLPSFIECACVQKSKSIDEQNT